MIFKASTRIAAPPQIVWDLITDPARFPEWDPSCERIEGELRLGNQIKAHSKLSPGRAFPVRVTELDPTGRMTWIGGMPLGLFRGVRTFTLEATPSGYTRFELREEFTGPMLRLIKRSLPDFGPVFERAVAGLKEQAEAAAIAA